MSIYKIIGVILLLAPPALFAQRQLPASYPVNIKTNYVRTWDATAPEKDPNNLMIRPLADVKQTTVYYDGLYRPIQTVARQGSLETGSAAKDMVRAIEYDVFGRQVFKYLPFAANNAGGNTAISDGAFKLNPFQQQAAFYNTLLAGQQGETNVGANGENWAYGKYHVEASPLNRVTETYAPGSSWIGSEMDPDPAMRRSVKQQYLINDQNDLVRIWTVNGSSFSTSSTYPAGTLYKNVMIDERGRKVIEYITKDEQVVLRKMQLADNPAADHQGWLCTYYVYEDEKIRLTIQPKGVELLQQNSWDINALNGDILNEHCFIYTYDGRGRVITRKVPGAGEKWVIYDKWDRVVLTQEANQRTGAQKKWLFTKYDQLSRPIMSGVYINNTYLTQAAMQAYVDAQAMGRYEADNFVTFPYTLTQSFPSVNAADVFTVTYYDDYRWAGWYGGNFASKDNSFDSYFLPVSNATHPYAQSLNSSSATKGFVTGEWQNTGPGILKGLYYDEEGRVIQTKDFNFASGTDIETIQYNFAGQVLQTLLKQEKPGSNAQTHTLITKYSYDDLGRLLSVTKKVNSTINSIAVNKPEVEITNHAYDAAGQLKNKTLGKKKDASNNYTTDPVETLAYDYNIRGWLLGINRNYLISNGSGGNYFGFELGYDKQANTANRNFTNVEYNGNIAGMLWKSAGDGVRRKYDYAYDNTSRLLRADFEQHNADNSWSNLLVNFSVKMGDDLNPAASAYDANGNILRMRQWGLKITGIDMIDDLRYTYYHNGNRLKNVIDFKNDPDTRLGDFRTTVNHPQKTAKQNYVNNVPGTDVNSIIDYDYDANGNLIKDLNKDIGTSSAGGDIVYNYMNLPETITMRNPAQGIKGTIDYVYDRAGNKIKKTVVDNSTAGKTITTTTTYLKGLVYESRTTQNPGPKDPPDYTDRLLFIGHEEGRLRFVPAVGPTAAHFEHDYFVKDHLGNVRMVLTEERQQDIYPAATLEGDLNTNGVPNAAYYEKDYYKINPANIVSKADATGITGYPNKNGGPAALDPPVNNNPNSQPTALSDKLYKLEASGTGGVTGLGIAIKVMSGDRVDVFGKSYYFENNASQVNYNIPVIDLLTGLLGTPGGATAGKGVTATQLSEITDISTDVFNFLNNGRTVTTTPKAYINWILFDDNFKYVTGGFDQVGGAGSVKDHNLSNIAINRNGFLYVYISNESPVKVFFDNLQLIHTRGPLTEETHYYPFGLTMAGISSKAAGMVANKRKFNDATELESKEFSDDSGLELYATDFRSYDPQIGRFHQPDQLLFLFESFSPYTYAFNNPILLNDPTGLASDTATPLPPVVVTPPKQPKARPAGALPIHIVLPNLRPVPPPPTPPGPGRIVPMPRPSPGPPSPKTTPGIVRRIGPPPEPTIGPRVGVGLGTLVKGVGLTVFFLLLPMEAGGPAPAAYPTKPYPGHKNNKENWNPHIVYAFHYTPPNGKSPTLKYGISDVYSQDLDRPERQLPGLRKDYGKTVDYYIFKVVQGREAALFVEKMMVTLHYRQWGYVPIEQLRPLPDIP